MAFHIQKGSWLAAPCVTQTAVVISQYICTFTRDDDDDDDGLIMSHVVLKSTVFWYVTLHCLIEFYWNFGGMCSTLIFKVKRISQGSSHCVTSQKQYSV
jgi:hypothetical protein